MQFASNWNLSENVQLQANCMQLAFFMKNCCFKFSFIFPQWAFYMFVTSVTMRIQWCLRELAGQDPLRTFSFETKKG